MIKPLYKKALLLLATFAGCAALYAGPPGGSEKGEMQDLWQTLLAEAGINPTGNTLPVGIAKQINGTVYAIALDELKKTERGPSFSAFARLEFPGTSTVLAFGARDILVGPGGLRTSAEGAKLTLENEINIPFSPVAHMILPADGGNYVVWDCDGFKSINLKGEIEFRENTIIPADGARGSRVRATFEVHSESLHDLRFRINMPAFKIPGAGITLEARNVWVDISDLSNPDNIIFPAGYNLPFSEAEKGLWRGFYAEEVSITLPKEFESSTKFSTKNLIIDNMGVSVKLVVENISCMAKADTWPVSINSILIEIIKNKLRGGSMAGHIKVPVLGYDSLKYSASIHQNESDWDYMFSVITNKDKEYDLPALAAKLRIDKGSWVEVKRINKNFSALASLNGVMLMKNNIATFSDIKFQRLTLESKAPFITDGVISVDSNPNNKAGNFPVTFNSIRLDINKGEPFAHFDLNINFMDQLSFSGKTQIGIYSEMKTNSGRLQWGLKRVEIKEVSINSDMGAFKLAGSVNFFDNDPVYGNGFRGALKLNLAKLLSDIDAQMYFGSKDDFRYWQGSVRVPTKIPLPVPSMFLTSLKGGIAYQMVRPTNYKTSTMEETKADVADVYIPDKTAGLSFLAGAGVGVASDILAAKAELEVTFATSGGLKLINFKGDAAFMANAKTFSAGSGNKNSPVKASLNMSFNNDIKAFDAIMIADINVAGVLKGGGRSDLHFDPSGWYIYVGKPDAMFGLNFIGVLKTNSYLMVGSRVENVQVPSDALQKKLANYIPGIIANFATVESSYKAGNAFGFGSHFDMNFGFGRNGGFVYAFLDIGAGSDIMLRQYKDFVCEGKTGSIGIDGWYASGQAYAYLQGRVGIRAARKEFDILGVSMGSVLQAKAPNPAWFHGDVSARYRLLGGLVKGSVNVPVTIGTECKLINTGKEIDLQIIGDIKPGDSEKEISVFSSPQVAFNAAMESEVKMLNFSNVVESYRVRLDEFNVNGIAAAGLGNLQWNEDKNVIVLNPKNVLKQKSDFNISVKVHIERKEANGSWQHISDGKGNKDFETRSVKFTTGPEPDYLTKENVKYTYPVESQYNFLTKEYDKGYIQLKQGVNIFFDKDANGTWSYLSKFTAADGKSFEVPIKYNNGGATVELNTLPDFALSKIYKMQIIRRMINSGSVDRNMKQETKKLEQDGAATDTEISSNKLEGSIAQTGEKVLYEFSFRTSRYKTFAEKMDALTDPMDLCYIAGGEAYVIGKRYYANEDLDRFEIAGQPGSFDPLVFGEAEGKELWYKDFINPVIYDYYAKGDASLTISRVPGKQGIKPMNAIKFYNDNSLEYKLEDSQISMLNAVNHSGRVFIEYNVPYYTYKDYYDLKQKAATKYKNIQSAPENAKRLLQNPGYIEIIPDKHYSIKFSYRLPGVNQITSSKTVSIYF